MMQSNLEPCPFCGTGPSDEHNETQVQIYTSHDWFSAHCESCGAETADYPSHDEAIAAWNTRVPTRPVDDTPPASGLVEQIDRDAAADLIESYYGAGSWAEEGDAMRRLAQSFRAGHGGLWPEAFARHRLRHTAPTAPVAPDGDRICEKCGCNNPPWFADSPLWNRVVGGPNATGDPGGVWCANCFIFAAGEHLRVTLPDIRDRNPPTPTDTARPAQSAMADYVRQMKMAGKEPTFSGAADYVEASIASLIAGPLPEGFVAVPVEPTEAMIDAGTENNAAIMHNLKSGGWRSITSAIYAAMIAARPTGEQA